MVSGKGNGKREKEREQNMKKASDLLGEIQALEAIATKQRLEGWLSEREHKIEHELRTYLKSTVDVSGLATGKIHAIEHFLRDDLGYCISVNWTERKLTISFGKK